MRRGDSYLCDFGDPIGHEQRFQRPALIVSHDEMARHGLPVVLPITRAKRGYPTHAELEDVLPVTSYVQSEMMRIEQILRRILAL